MAEINPSDLLGPGEVCRALARPNGKPLDRASFMRYRKRDDFPKPFVVLSIGPVWLRADITRWKR